MRTKTSLLGGAALSLVLACSLTSVAQAAPKHRAAPAASSAQLDELRAQVQALTEKLNSLEAAQQKAQSDADAAQAAATQAASQAQAAQAAQAAADAQIKMIPQQVKTEVAAAAPKPGWEKNTSVSGRMYYDITSINQESNGVKVPGGPNGVNFDIKRFYVGIDHTFNKTFSANITTDFTYDGAAGATQIYIKKAYLQAKLSDALTLRLGSADLPWIPFVEDIYGYRYVENTLADRTKFGTSADWGVHALGKLPVSKDLTINYAVAAINGAGYKKPGIGTANRSKGIDLEGRISATAMKHFTVAVGGYTGKLGKDVQGTTTYNTATRFDALAAYTDDRIRIGGEYFHASDWNDVTQANPTLTNTSDGWSVFGSYKFTPKVAVFGRYDWVKPKKDTAPDLKDNYFNVGVQYSPAKIVDFALVYKRDKVDNGFISTSNGNIGGSTDGTYDEFGLWGQFRW